MEEKRRQLYVQIREWNEHRLDLFAISEPNLDLEFFGVMRFYFQDELQELGQKVSTKCIRVSSTASARDVLATLVEKFRPDIRMLTASQYGLYEVHTDLAERRLQDWECPLLVQLNWGKDDREGRILMKRLGTLAAAQANGFGGPMVSNGLRLSRKLSKREKKEQKKREQEAQAKGTEPGGSLYNELPESVLTRSISNPEMVMRKRRELKLEKKLQQIRTSDGGPESGGTLKIYGGTICPEVPYKTLLLSERDRADYVVKETLDKYGLGRDDPRDYCLVQVITPYRSDDYYADAKPVEYILNDNDYPLDLLIHAPPVQGQVTFHLRRRSPNEMRRWNTEVRQPMPPGSPLLDRPPEHPAVPYTALRPDQLPYLLEINADGSKLASAQSFTIPINGLEVGCERASPQGMSHLLLRGGDICRRHCVFRYADTVVTLARLDRDAIVSVNKARVNDTVMLRVSDVILLGSGHFLKFVDPSMARGSVPVEQLQKSLPLGSPIYVGVQVGLPATVEYRENAEDRFIAAVFSDSAFNVGGFRFLPTYSVYMAARHLLGLQQVPVERIRRFIAKSTGAVFEIIQKQMQRGPPGLALWMANASELLHFLSRDTNLTRLSAESRDQLARSVQLAFTSLVKILKEDINQVLPAILDGRPDAGEVDDDALRRMRPAGTGPLVSDVVRSLSDILSLLLRAHVNAALTIQLFSQLFHHINQWLFNRLIQPQAQLCTRDWGSRLLMRLRAVEVWAERQGLELAADCHLARILQAAHVLQAAKASDDDITDVCSACFKLNSMQIGALLQNYIPARDEPRIAPELVSRAVLIARNTADETARSEGQEVTLYEDAELRLPFLLPEDGYSCEYIQGVPDEMQAFFRPLSETGLCRLLLARPEFKMWTVYFGKSGGNEFSVVPSEGSFASQKPRTVSQVSFRKINNSIGLSIVAAMGEGRTERSIYVKSVVPGGAAATDGRIQTGDLLLEVDGRSLHGLTQEAAAALMGQTGSVVTLKVVHQGAVFDGLAMLLNQASPGSPVAVTQQPPAVAFHSPVRPIDGTLQQSQQPKPAVQPSGGHYSRVTYPVPTRSKSSTNLNQRDPNNPYDQGPAITVLKATNNMERDTTIRGPANTRPVDRQQADVRTTQYPYVPPQSSRTNAPVARPAYESDPRNRPTNAPVRIPQPPTIQVPRSNVSRPYSAQGQHAVNQPYQTMNQPVYSQPRHHAQTYASQPNLAQASLGNGYPAGNYDQQQGVYMDQSRGTYATNLPGPGTYVRQDHRQRVDVYADKRPGGPVTLGYNSQVNPSSRYNDAMERPAGRLGVDQLQEEPQYARVAPRGPRSQSVPRSTQDHPPSSTEVPRPPSASPWAREERENERKVVEREKRVLRDEEIRALESRGVMLGRDDVERLRRLRLEADFDRRLDEVSSREDDQRDDEELTPAGRASLARMMQEDLKERSYRIEQRGEAEERRLNPPRGSDAVQADRQSSTWLRDLEASGFQRVDQAGCPPPPPERKSSYDVYRVDDANGLDARAQAANNMNKKTVSFTSSVPEIGVQVPGVMQGGGGIVQGTGAPQAVKGRQQSGYPYVEQSTNFRNPNFGKASTPPRSDAFSTDIYGLQNSGVPGTPVTPGVIGTQELYRDPRDRRMEENRAYLGAQGAVMPERMSFRDKMKHFAHEAGEETPGNRAKESRAQRVLEMEMNGR